MSKSFGNVVNPDEIVVKYGADALRIYEMFMGPFDQAIAWSEQGVKGVARFLDRVWALSSKPQIKNQTSEVLVHKTIKKVSDDLKNIKFNTIVSALMTLVNKLEEKEQILADDYEKLLLLLSPFAPHLAEELWQKLGHKTSIFEEPWPEADKKLLKEDKITLVVQVNGRVRDTLEAKAGLSENEARALAISSKKVHNWVSGKEIKKVIFVPNKLINLIV
jgi:leucyl-tRNA synthetase